MAICQPLKIIIYLQILMSVEVAIDVVALQHVGIQQGATLVGATVDTQEMDTRVQVKFSYTIAMMLILM